MNITQWFSLSLLLFSALFPSRLPAALPSGAELDLLPVPQTLETREGKFRLQETFALEIHSSGAPLPRMQEAAGRWLQRLAGRTGLFLRQDCHNLEKQGLAASLSVRFRQSPFPRLGVDESYTLEIGAERIELQAVSDIGAMRGLETLLQLVKADAQGYYLPCLRIADHPRYTWRGLMIDSCRHFLPLEVILRNLDAMAAVKLNVLHWHLSEDQGFRVECRTFPKLHQLASDGLYYTREQIRTVVEYAAARGIRVVPEFDIPGHSTSWLTAYPELASAPGPYTIERKWGIFDPTFDPSNPAVYRFFERFFREITTLFPDDYMHIGGDENSGKQWDANPRIQAFKRKHNIPDNHSLQAWFNLRIHRILTRCGKKMMGWDESLHPQLPKSIVIQSWRGPQFLMETARSGYMGLLANGYYIDLIQPAEFHYGNDPLAAAGGLTEEQQKLILGGEATMWAEFISPETVDSRIWPRTAAIAERLWSAAEVRDMEDMYRRLEIISRQLEEHGVTHLKNQAMMLRRLAGGYETAPLQVFLEVLEPLKEYRRGDSGVAYTACSPLTRLVDAAAPEAMPARRFRRLCTAYAAGRDSVDAGRLWDDVKRWQENLPAMRRLLERSPMLREMAPMLDRLNETAEIARRALQILENNLTAEAGWAAQAAQRLQAAREQCGQLELMIVSGVETLVKAAAGEKATADAAR